MQEKKVEVLSCMEVDQAAALLKRLAKPERNMLIDLIDNESKRDIAMLESFDEDEIGSRMSMNFLLRSSPASASAKPCGS